jgi:4-amino-4-deoxy-L-arabinose transferase-like glycosyltransferase
MTSNATTKLVLCLVVFLAFILRALFLDSKSLSPDEGLYLCISRNLMTDPSAIYDCEGNFFFQNPPFFMYLLSFCFMLTGGPSLWAAHLFNALLGTATVLVTFLIAENLYGKKVGLVSALLLALNPLHWWISTRITNDLLLTFLIYFSIFILIHGHQLAFYLFSFLGFATKYPSALLFFLPLLSPHPFKKKGIFFLSTYVLVIFCLATLRAYHLKLNLPWADYFIAFFRFPSLDKVWLETNYFFGPILLFFFVIGFVNALKTRQYSPLLIWIILFGLARLFLPWAWTRIARYSLPLYPGLIILASYGGMRAYSFIERKTSIRRIFLASLFVLIFLWTVLDSATKGRSVIDLTNKSFIGFEEIHQFLKDKPIDLRILTSSPCQVKFFAPRAKVLDLKSLTTEQEACNLMKTHGIDYILVDRWSPHQPDWVPHYFLPEKGFMPWFETPNFTVFSVPPRCQDRKSQIPGVSSLNS